MEKKLSFQFFMCMLCVAAFAIICLIFAVSCTRDGQLKTYHYKKQVMMNVSDLRVRRFSLTQPREIGSSGKIYIYGDYLFINEPGLGVHIVNNVNPSMPKQIAFIEIPGNEDVAIKDNILYADNFVDLLAFNISNPLKVKFIKRIQDVYPALYIDKAKGSFYGYKDTVVTEKMEDGTFFASVALNSSSKSQGQGGSMARFTLMNNYLYTVTSNEMKLFDVSTASDPKYIKNIFLGWGIETIFPYQNKLFIGTTGGMRIYDATVPESPSLLSTYAHFTSCDPVIVEGKYAYVTLRTGVTCARGLNQLEVVDISDIKNPVQVKVYPMKNPYGLALSGSSLFVCEGEYGLKLLDAGDVNDIKLFRFLTGVKAMDVITGPRSLIVTGDDGVNQFEYLNGASLKWLSKIRVRYQPAF